MNQFLRTFSICIFLTLFNAGLMAQYYVNKEWISQGGVAQNLDWASSTFDAQGNLIVVGNKLIDPGNSDILTTKYDTDGNTLWQQTFDGPASGLDYGVKAISDAQSNTFVAGTVLGTSSELDIVLIKYDPNGALLWSTTWNGNADLIDVPTCMLLDPNGHLYVGGITHASLTDIDYALVKFDANGQIIWSSTYDHTGLADMPTGIELDVASNPVLTGGSASSVSNWDFATVIYNQMTGLQLQVSRIATPGVGLDRAFGIAKDVNANLFITGYTENMGNWDAQTVKLDPNFDLEWTMTYDGYGLADAAKAIGTDDQGNVIITGYTTVAQGGSEFITIKYDAQGVLQWRQNYRPKDPTWLAVANSIVVESDGACLVTGSMGNGSDKDFVTIKYSAGGKLLWTKQHDGGNGDDDSKDIITDGQGNIFITGLSNTGAGMEYTTIKYSEFHKENNILYDQNGTPLCVAGEVIIKFRPDIMDTAMVNNLDRHYGELTDFVPQNVVDDMIDALGTKTAPEDIMAFKIHRTMRTSDTISISRLGDEVCIPEFWSSLLVTVKNMDDPFATSDSLSQHKEWWWYAEPNHVYQLSGIPDDTYINPPFDLQPNLVPTTAIPNAHINMDEAWDIQTGFDYVRVGVIDDGIYYEHEDFDPGNSSHRVGYQGFCWEPNWGWAFNFAQDPNKNHGTAVAGIIGAIRNNGTGIAGIAGGDYINHEGALIHTLDVSFDGLNVTISSVEDALFKACADLGTGTLPSSLGYGFGIHALNNSWGGASLAPGVQNGLHFCHQNQVVITASKGNDTSVGSVPSATYPADYTDDNWVVSVGGSGNDGTRANGLNGAFGWEANYHFGIDIVAPATEDIVISTIKDPNDFIPVLTPTCPIYTPSPTSVYGCFDGLSAATPHVTGVAALMLCEYNVLNGAPHDLAPEDVENIIEATATDVGPPNYDVWNGHGRLNAGEALAKVHYPQYEVYHSVGSPITSIDTPEPSRTITYNPYLFYNQVIPFLPYGIYTANPVKVTQTFTNLFPTMQVIGLWGRTSSGLGIGYTSTTDVLIDHRWQQVTSSNYSGNQADITIETYCWHFTADNLGNPIDVWIPAEPSQLETAYSVHLHNSEPVGINEEPIDKNGLLLFPSPVEDILNLKLKDGFGNYSQIEVFDSVGRLVMSRLLSTGNSTIFPVSVNHLEHGSYIIQLIEDEKMYYGKFLKQ